MGACSEPLTASRPRRRPRSRGLARGSRCRSPAMFRCWIPRPGSAWDRARPRRAKSRLWSFHRTAAASPYSKLMAKQWDIQSGKELRRLESDYGGRFVTPTDLKFSTTGDRVIAASSNNVLVLWDVDSGRKQFEVSFRDQDFKSIAFS